MSEPVNDTPAAPLKPPRRAWWKTLTLSVALLASGVVIGSALTLIGIRHRLDEYRSRPDLLSQRMVERMERDLELTGDQKAEIKKIFAETREQADSMRQRNRAQAQAFFREFQGKVAQVLTPSQQEAWEEWFRKARERAFRGRSGGHDEKKGGDKSDRGFRERDERPRSEDAAIGPPPIGIPERNFASPEELSGDAPAPPPDR